MAVMAGTHDELTNVLGVCEDIRLTPMIWGTYGIGKTEVVHRYAIKRAKKAGRRFVIWHELTEEQKVELFNNSEKLLEVYIMYDNRAASNDSTDDKGIPSLSNQGYQKWIQPLIYKVFEKPEAMGMVFNDELTLAPTLVMNAMYKMVYDHAVGDTKLNKDVTVVCAGNRASDMAFVQEMPMPKRTRMLHFLLEQADPDDQLSYFLKIGVDNRLIAFFTQHPSMMQHHEPDSDELTANRPRVIERCSDAIKHLSIEKDKRLIELVSCGLMTTFVGSMFIKYLENTRTVDVDDILRHPSKAKNLQTLDEQYGLVTLIADKFGIDKSEGNDVFKAAIKVYKNLPEEIAVLMLRMMKAQDSPRFMKVGRTAPEIREIILRASEILL